MRAILTEKPSVARDIARALGAQRKETFFFGKDFCVLYAAGHLYEIDDRLAPKEWRAEDLPILPPSFRYQPLGGKRELLREIKGVLSKAQEVVIATDPGREGELIARIILHELGWRNWDRTFRLWTAEALTPEVVRREMGRLKPASDFDSLYYSALGRQQADWLVGINLTRALTLRASQGLWSVGRVQTPTLALVVQREREIKNFVPTPYGIVWGFFTGDNFSYRGKLLWERVLPPEKAETLARSLVPGSEGVVESIESEDRILPPPLLHSLSTLQREANRRYGYSAKKTLDLAQALYEEHKCISYPRTDSQHLPVSARSLVKEVLTKLGHQELIGRVNVVGKRIFDDSKLTDHHAIIPLAPLPPVATEDQARVYRLILNRFLAAFHPPAKVQRVEVITRLGEHRFQSLFRKVLEPGFTLLEGYTLKGGEEMDGSPDSPIEEALPSLNPKERVVLREVESERRETQPPPRYTEGSLIGLMERLGLGTPATRAAILETLKERGYLLPQGKGLVPTEKGEALIDLVGGRQIANPQMTAGWERELEAIWQERRGEGGYRLFVEAIARYVREETAQILRMEVPKVKRQATPKMLSYARNLARQTGKKLEGTDFDTVKAFIDEAKGLLDQGLGLCACGQRITAFSRGWKCQGGHTVFQEFLGKRLTLRQALTLLTGGEVTIRGLKGKSGKPFGGVLRYNHGESKVQIARFLQDTKDRTALPSKR